MYMKNLWIWLVVAAVVVVGCGGSSTNTNGGTTGTGAVSGVVFDQTGGVVSSAHVWTDQGGGRTTNANMTGAYLLSSVIGTDVTIQAESYRGGLRYYGQNVTTVTSNESSKNVNIALYPTNALATVEGDVRDSSGHLLQGVKVFARQNAANTVLSSAVAVSDASGHYRLNSLVANIDYAIQANGLNYTSDSTVVNLRVNEDRTLNLNVPNYSGPIVTLPAPTGLMATAWTSPAVETRNPNRSNTLAAIKAALGYRAPKKSLARNTALGNPIEVDLLWNPVINSSTLGYGIYRAAGSGPYVNTDFYRDPLGEFFADQDTALTPGNSYTYTLTTLSTSFTGGSGLINGESGFSTSATVSPLGDVLLNSPVIGGNVQFSWGSTLGAATYSVVIYGEQPTIGSSPTYISPSVSTTTLNYSGSDLITGGRYYYVVVASSTTGDKSVSSLGTFVR